MKVPEYFVDKELECRCGCKILPPEKSVRRLYAVRLILQKPMPISSAARCWKHNVAVGGKPGSIHLPPDKRRRNSSEWGGGAFDIIATPGFQMEIVEAAIFCGFTGFGFADTFLHLDDAERPEITRWTY